MTVFPSLFVSHGAPTLALADSPAGTFLDGLGNALGRPRAVVVASAHYAAPGPRVGAHPAPRTIHDFGGFPAELYRLRYAAPGDPALAQRCVDLLAAAGFAAAADAQAGLDHGAWVPLLRAYPDADVPVVPISVDPTRDAAWHYGVGRALAPLRDDGVLVLGSGGFVHNLGALDPRAGGPPAWAQEFHAWLDAKLAAGDVDAALQWHDAAPHARRAHPTPEHLLPLFVAWGASGGAPARLLHRSWELGTLALDAYAFGDARNLA